MVLEKEVMGSLLFAGLHRGGSEAEDGSRGVGMSRDGKGVSAGMRKDDEVATVVRFAGEVQ